MATYRHTPRDASDRPPNHVSWRDRAACLDKDPELFFPTGSTGRALEQAEQAKAVCAGCPVRTQCLDWALTTGQDAGIWGGKTEDERRTLRRVRQRRTAKP
jgi:WhiB family transcriptional regulator, redox-sensing transcriptional regulator